MSVTTNQIPHNKSTDPPIIIPEILYEKWDINQYLRITDRHIIVSANQKKSGICRVLALIPEKYFSKKLWKTLIRLPDNKLLLPQKIHVIKDMHVLEFPLCTSLKKLVQTQGLSLSQIISLILDLCNSLRCLHDVGILHMDISVDNIYLTEEQHFILGDFSESCYQAEADLLRKELMPLYPAPECQNTHPSVLSEQYQLGILFYQLCNDGNAPPPDFCGTVPHSLPIFQAVPKLSNSLKAILSKMLAQDPAERYSDLPSLQLDLETLASCSVEQSDYQLFLPDETHAFHQTRTLISANITSPSLFPHSLTTLLPSISLPPISFRPLFVLLPLIMVCLTFILLFCKGFSSTANRTDGITEATEGQISTGAAFSSSSEEIPTNVSTILDIAGKHLTSITSACPSNLKGKTVHTLLAENNCITSLSDISLLPNLREVYLSNNQITDLHDLTALPNLEIIVLSDNDCTNLSGLETLYKLRFLDLSGNSELAEISELYTLTSLETLILSDTSVSENTITQLKEILPECRIIY